MVRSLKSLYSLDFDECTGLEAALRKALAAACGSADLISLDEIWTSS